MESRKITILLLLILATLVFGQNDFLLGPDSTQLVIPMGDTLVFEDSCAIIFDFDRDTTDADTGKIIFPNLLALFDSTFSGFAIKDSLSPAHFYFKDSLWYVRQDSLDSLKFNLSDSLIGTLFYKAGDFYHLRQAGLDSLGQFARKYVGRGLWDNGADSIRIDLQPTSGMTLLESGLGLDRADAANYDWTNESHNLVTTGTMRGASLSLYPAGETAYFQSDVNSANYVRFGFSASTGKWYFDFWDHGAGSHYFPFQIDGNTAYFTNTSGIDYGDLDNTPDLSGYLTEETDPTFTNEAVQDIVGAMVTGNSETRISVIYDDAANEFDFIVDDMNDDSPDDDSEVPDAITVTPINTATEQAIEQVVDHDDLQGYSVNQHRDWTTDQGATNIHPNNYTDTNTQLSTEQVQDIIGAMVSGNTEDGINVIYEHGDGTLDFDVTVSGGGISSVIAGSGLSGGGSSGDVTLSLDDNDARNENWTNANLNFHTSGYGDFDSYLQVGSNFWFTTNDRYLYGKSSGGSNVRILGISNNDHLIFGQATANLSSIKFALNTGYAIEIDSDADALFHGDIEATAITGTTAWNGADIDVSSYTNLGAYWPLYISGDNVTLSYMGSDFSLYSSQTLQIKDGGVDSTELATDVRSYVKKHGSNLVCSKLTLRESGSAPVKLYAELETVNGGEAITAVQDLTYGVTTGGFSLSNLSGYYLFIDGDDLGGNVAMAMATLVRYESRSAPSWSYVPVVSCFVDSNGDVKLELVDNSGFNDDWFDQIVNNHNEIEIYIYYRTE